MKATEAVGRRELAEKIAALRTAKKIPTRKLCKIAGIKMDRFLEIELGDVDATEEERLALAQALEVEPLYLGCKLFSEKAQKDIDELLADAGPVSAEPATVEDDPQPAVEEPAAETAPISEPATVEDCPEPASEEPLPMEEIQTDEQSEPEAVDVEETEAAPQAPEDDKPKPQKKSKVICRNIVRRHTVNGIKEVVYSGAHTLPQAIEFHKTQMEMHYNRLELIVEFTRIPLNDDAGERYASAVMRQIEEKI